LPVDLVDASAVDISGDPAPSIDLAVDPPVDLAPSPSQCWSVPCAAAVLDDAYATCVHLSQSCSGPFTGQCGPICRTYCFSTGTHHTYFRDGTTEQFGWSLGAPRNCRG